MMRKLIIVIAVSVLFSPLNVFAQNSELVKSAEDPKVYRVISGKKLWVPNEQIFLSYGYRWADIKTVRQTYLNNLGRIKLLKTPEHAAVYYLTESGMKRPFINENVFLSYGNKWEDIYTINQMELESYTTNTLIQGADGQRYKIEGMSKVLIPTQAVFDYYGFSADAVAPVNNTELNAYQTVDILSLPEKQTEDNAVSVPVIPQVRVNAITDKGVYYSGQNITLTVALQSNVNLEGVRIEAEGIVNKLSYPYFSESATVSLQKDIRRTVAFVARLPECSSCTGIFPGPYSIDVKIYNGTLLLGNASASIQLNQ